MTRSLVILLLALMVGAVGYYYERQGRPEGAVSPQSMAGAAVPQNPVAASGPRSGVQADALDRSTRAQDDFYRFANGGWLDATEIPSIYSGYTVYHEVHEQAESELRGVIEQAASDPGEPGTERQKVGDLFSSWMDIEAINALGLQPVRPELERIGAIDSVASLVATMARLRRAGVEVPYELSVYGDLKDSSRYTVYIEQSGITMPNRDYYLDLENENFRKAREALPAYIAGLLAHAGLERTAADAAGQAVYDLEAALAGAQWDAVTNRDPEKIYNPYPVADLGTLGPNIDWTATRDLLGIAAQDPLIIEQPSFFEALDRLLVEIPLGTWKHYLAFRLLDSSAEHLDDATAAIQFDYRYRILNGQEEQRPRWKRGISAVNMLIGEAAGKLYVREYFPPEAKDRMEHLVENVIATFDETLQGLDWMTPATRQKAREKLAGFTAKIGYPDEWKDYSELQVVRGDHFGNWRRALEWEHRRQVSKIGQPVDRGEWYMTPQTVNAYYSPTQNEIVFPAARLQPPFFQLDADDAINYGAVGGVIGHEISHGFDDKGSKFDGNGNLSNWWTEQDRAAFEARTATLVEQFNAFEPVPGMNVNGELTLGENIGDLSGVAMAYRAYIRSLEGADPPVIDGFTGPQRFFIGYAMSRRGKYRDEAVIARLASAPHSPLKYRVIGPYRNIDAFHEAFGTAEGDGMWLPPDQRVRIW